MSGPWASPEQLQRHLRLDAIDIDTAVQLLADAEDVIRAALGQTVDQVLGDTAELVGSGTTLLLLPELPVTAVTAVTIDGTTVPASGYRWNRHGALTRLDGVWPLDAVVRVTNDHGWSDLPTAFTRVCVQVAGRSWVNPAGVDAESLGDRSITYAKGRSGEELTSYEEGLLARYSSGYNSR
ncbi:hypothetical protein OG401_21040 [Kitasatospora purpeofusca]|uniref:hypothetical protein n=1 Tax=Kitasatospora purpeofusca TaxID=67352 RepID=UPI002255513D|nr:hypothetical protein [Kitasatospora purpeofusca]MCX4686767.1 hypothetical protein [Kitasatospora purpeofusca]